MYNFVVDLSQFLTALFMIFNVTNLIVSLDMFWGSCVGYIDNQQLDHHCNQMTLGIGLLTIEYAQQVDHKCKHVTLEISITDIISLRQPKMYNYHVKYPNVLHLIKHDKNIYFRKLLIWQLLDSSLSLYVLSSCHSPTLHVTSNPMNTVHYFQVFELNFGFIWFIYFK